MTTKRNKQVISRKTIKSKDKKEMLNLYKQGYSHQEIANQFDVGRSTVTKIIKLQSSSSGDNPTGLKQERKQLIDAKLEKVEESLLKFYCEKIFINNEIEHIVRKGLKQADLINAAKCLALKFDMTNFKPTGSWFFKLRRKYNLIFQNKDDEINKPLKHTNTTIISSNVPDFYNAYFQSQQIPFTFNNGIDQYQSPLIYSQDIALTIPTTVDINQLSELYSSPTVDVNLVNDVNPASLFQDYSSSPYPQNLFYF